MAHSRKTIQSIRALAEDERGDPATRAIAQKKLEKLRKQDPKLFEPSSGTPPKELWTLVELMEQQVRRNREQIRKWERREERRWSKLSGAEKRQEAERRLEGARELLRMAEAEVKKAELRMQQVVGLKAPSRKGE